MERGSWTPFLEAEPLDQRAGGVVADDHLDRDDLHFANQLLAHVEPAHEMRGHADLVEPRHQVLGDAVVEHPLAGNHALLLVVESGGVVLEILHQGAGLGPFVEDLRLAFVDPPATGHGRDPRCGGRGAGVSETSRTRYLCKHSHIKGLLQSPVLGSAGGQVMVADRSSASKCQCFQTDDDSEAPVRRARPGWHRPCRGAEARSARR